VQAIEFARAALPTFFTVLAVFYASRLMAGRARFGALLDDVGSPGTVQHMSHSLFRVFRIAIWLVCVIRAIEPSFDDLLGVIPSLMHPAPVLFGLVLLLGGFGWVGYCHSYMGLDWRSGVPQKHAPNLIISGPFARLRHPMFMGIIVAQVGFFFALPSFFSLVCLLFGLLALISQSRFEEEEMAKRLGEPYEAYRDSVPGWMPRRLSREGQPAE
jgi:protein-S-isoprenylcysteine O-methyltransferase Ste14